MRVKTLFVLALLVGAILCSGGGEAARAASYPLPFDPFLAPESFGCKHLLIPGAELLPHDPVIDPKLLPGWKAVPMKDGKNRTIESLVIKGSTIVHKKDRDGKPTGPPMVLIPAGGLVYDATPLETHLPVGDQGVIFGHRAILVKKELKEETCRNFSVLAGRSFVVGDSVITYLMPGPKGGPAVLWRTLDGVSIRPHPLDEYPAGQVPEKTSTRIFGAYTHAGQIAEYASFSGPLIVEESWRIDGEEKTVATNSEWFPHFRIVPISCPIGHHIGLMVYNDVPILLDTSHEMTLYGGALKIRLVTVHEKAGKVVFTLNGRPYTGSGGIDSLIGKGRAIAGIENTLATLRKLRGS
ncbi:MAG: hypothetical protein M1509_04985 [Nitrospirae bacterium]|nr:hypothetical protein [Nitrospirota bacterium]